ncbi:hypothetical protein HQS1_25130 [Delftia lacustris]|nr:hypothetical protein HQS1_25130 [Delftia lacustris]
MKPGIKFGGKGLFAEAFVQPVIEIAQGSCVKIGSAHKDEEMNNVGSRKPGPAGMETGVEPARDGRKGS